MTTTASAVRAAASARRSVVGAAGLVLLLSACAGTEAEDAAGRVFSNSGDVAVVDGRMVLPEGMEIPSTARAETRLVDLDRTGTDGDFLVASSVTDASSAPVPFRLQWRPGALPEGHRYVVSARLIGRSGTLYTTEEPVSVAAVPTRQNVTLTLVPTGADLSDEEGPSYSIEGIPDPSQTEDMPMTRQGDLESMYDDRLGDDSLSDFINSDDYGGRVISPEPLGER